MKVISMEVPVVIRADLMAYPPSPDRSRGEVAANMLTPGAVISGCPTQIQQHSLKRI